MRHEYDANGFNTSILNTQPGYNPMQQSFYGNQVCNNPNQSFMNPMIGFNQQQHMENNQRNMNNMSGMNNMFRNQNYNNQPNNFAQMNNENYNNSYMNQNYNQFNNGNQGQLEQFNAMQQHANTAHDYQID